MPAHLIEEPFEQNPSNSPGGMVEAVKTGVINALRATFVDSPFSNDERTDEATLHVDMEYPVAETSYPGIWVQFSTTKLEPAGMGHQTEAVGDDGEVVGLIRQWYYEGRVSLLVVALTSLERDRIADSIITEFAFQGAEEIRGLPTPSRFRETIEAYPYISIMVNSDSLTAGGQSTSVGTPWGPDILVYEDNYTFNIIGEFQQVRDVSGAVRLKRIDVFPRHGESFATEDSEVRSLKIGEWH